MAVDPLILRGIERILAVIIGGLAIYFGYRMFLAVPEQRADGRAELALAKDRRVLFTRIAPGTFFALFGTAVLIASYFFPVKTDGGSYSGFGARPSAGVAEEAAAPTPRRLETNEIRFALAFLGDAEATLATADSGIDPRFAARRFREIKLALMAQAWHEDWGDPVEFALWLEESPPRTARPAFERALAVMEARE